MTETPREVEVSDDESAREYAGDGEYVSDVHYTANNTEFATISEGYPCPDCTEVFDSQEALTGHKSAHNSDEDDSVEEEAAESVEEEEVDDE